MAYVSANLNMMVMTPGGGVRWWDYNAAGDTQAAIRVSGFMTDAVKKGMKVGDIVFARYTSRAMSIHNVVTATLGAVGANDTMDMTDGVAIAATNSD